MKPAKRPEKAPPTAPGRFAYEGLDRVFHEKARLGIMTSLATHSEQLSFAELRELCALSDGNLNRHLAVLSEAGFVHVDKEGGGRGSRTTCRATPVGRSAFLAYLQELERVLDDATRARASQGAPQGAAPTSGARLPARRGLGWSGS